LRGWERGDLEAEFGRYGGRLYELTRGIDGNPGIPDRSTQSISVEDTSQEDVLLAETESMIRRLAEALVRIAQRVSNPADSRAQAKDEGVQGPHPTLSIRHY